MGPTRVLSSLVALFAGVVLIVGGQGLLNTLVALRLESMDIQGTKLSLALSAYYVGWILGCFLVPGLMRRVAHIRTFGALAGLASAAAILHVLSPHALTYIALRLVGGFCFAGLLLTIESWVALHAPAEVRGGVLAVYLVVFYSGSGGGQFLLGAMDTATVTPFLVAALCFSLAGVPIALSRRAAPPVPDAAPSSPLRVFRQARTAVLAAFASGILISAQLSAGPIYLRRLGLSTGGVATWMGLTVLGGLLLQWPMGLLSDRIDRRRLVFFISLGAAGTAMGLAGVGAQQPGLWILGSLLGAFLGLIYPLALAHGNDRVAANESMNMGATLVLAAGLGSMLGPLIGINAMRVAGPAGLWMFLAGVSAALGLLCIYRITRRAAPTAAQSEPYVATVDTTIGALTLDPRVPEEEMEILEDHLLPPVGEDLEQEELEV